MNKACGIVLIDKPAGISSAGCVGKIRRTLGGVKVGHGGTLDPDATGLLVLFVGKATTLCDLIMDGEKGYEGEILAGKVTTTDDLGGEVIRDDTANAVNILKEIDLNRVCELFSGDLLQAPPQVSAVKIDGKRAYLRARKGEIFTTTPKMVHVSELSLTRLNDENPRYSNSTDPTAMMSPEVRPDCILKYRIRCSKGTYVRSLARDLGEHLKCGACVVSIRRTLATPFSIDNAVPLEELTDPESIRILPWHYPFRNAPQIVVCKDDLNGALNGKQAILHQLEERFLEVIGHDHRDAILVSEGIPKLEIGVFCHRAGKVRRNFFFPDHNCS
jgi:tRNA pseudouridine(55) synthase